MITLADNEETIALFKSKLNSYVEPDFSWEKLPAKSKGLSNAEIIQASEDALKEMVINDHNKVALPQLIKAIEDRNTYREIKFQ